MEKCKFTIIAIAVAVTIAIVLAIWSKAKPEDQNKTKMKENQDEENLDQSQLNLINLHYSIRNHSLISTSAIALILLCAVTIIYCKIKKNKQQRRTEWINMAAYSQQLPHFYPHRTMLTGIDRALGTGNLFPNPTTSTKQERQSMRMTDMQSNEHEPQRQSLKVNATHITPSCRNNEAYRNIPNPIPHGTKFSLVSKNVSPPQ